jgi:serine/threonine protein kinase
MTANRIGLGSLSEVYLAYELSTEKEVAIKVDPVFDKESSLER